MARDLASGTYNHPFLNLYKGAYLCVIPDSTPIEIDKVKEPYRLTEYDAIMHLHMRPYQAMITYHTIG